jgi:hypothetical protein
VCISTDDLLAKAPAGSRIRWTNLRARKDSAFRHENTVKLGPDTFAAGGIDDPISGNEFTRDRLEIELALMTAKRPTRADIRATVYIDEVEVLSVRDDSYRGGAAFSWSSSISSPGDVTLSHSVLSFTGTPTTHACAAGSMSSRTMPDDEPLTSQRPRQPCTPHAVTASLSGPIFCTEDRGKVERNPQPMTTRTESSLTHAPDWRGPSLITLKSGNSTEE